MNRNYYLLFFGFFLLTSSLFAQTAPTYAEDQLVIKIKSAMAPAWPFPDGETQLGIPEIDLLNAQNQLSHLRCMGKGKPKNPAIPRPADRTFVLTFTVPVDAMRLAETYMATGVLDFAEPNFIGEGGGKQVVQLIPNDTDWGKQWGFYNDGTFGFGSPVVDADVDMELAWDITTGNSNVIAAILDTGTKMDHPDIYTRIWSNPGEIAGNSTDDDSNGYGDDIRGWDFAYGDNDPTDDQGHGTNVMGILGATGNNATAYAGVDWNCQLMPIKILDAANYGYYSWWTDAFYYATDNGASVVNISAGGSGFSTMMLDAVNYAHANNVAIVACMMNNDVVAPYYPAAYDNTIAVGSTSPDDHRTSPFPWSPSSGSNFGNHIDVVAPGNYIYGLHYLVNNNTNTYWSGTSQAAPLVTGLCALMRGIDPSISVEDMRDILTSTAEDQVGDPSEDVAGFDRYYGHGRVNAGAALNIAVSRSKPLAPLEGITVFPNPATDQLTIRFEGDLAGAFQAELHDLTGKKQYSQRYELQPGQREVDWLFGDLPSGLYILTLQHKTKIGKYRISIQ